MAGFTNVKQQTQGNGGNQRERSFVGVIVGGPDGSPVTKEEDGQFFVLVRATMPGKKRSAMSGRDYFVAVNNDKITSLKDRIFNPKKETQAFGVGSAIAFVGARFQQKKGDEQAAGYLAARYATRALPFQDGAVDLNSANWEDQIAERVQMFNGITVRKNYGRDPQGNLDMNNQKGFVAEGWGEPEVVVPTSNEDLANKLAGIINMNSSRPGAKILVHQGDEQFAYANLGSVFQQNDQNGEFEVNIPVKLAKALEAAEIADVAGTEVVVVPTSNHFVTGESSLGEEHFTKTQKGENDVYVEGMMMLSPKRDDKPQYVTGIERSGFPFKGLQPETVNPPNGEAFEREPGLLRVAVSSLRWYKRQQEQQANGQQAQGANGQAAQASHDMPEDDFGGEPDPFAPKQDL